MMPATCVPWPWPSSRTAWPELKTGALSNAALAGGIVPIQAIVVDTGVEHGDANALAGPAVAIGVGRPQRRRAGRLWVHRHQLIET